ncbi:MAG: S41 family peptidase, partial [Bdellovibrionaceae bacterium]|nr:S41 family peptidase [Pseudobdellovibrionaceae bacterium]
IKRLDGAKMYLYQSDVALIQQKMKGVMKSVERGKCEALDEANAIYVKRIDERAEFAKKALEDKSFKFDPTTVLNIDPDSREYPKNRAEADKFHMKYLQFQLSNTMAGGINQEEAQQQLIRTYDRNSKRLKEKNQEDLYADYLDSFGRSLDPHSAFMSRDVMEDFQIQMGLSLEGIGATLSSQDGFTIVEQLIPGGSAKQSNLIQPQDKIVAVGQFGADGQATEMDNVIDMELRDVVRRIRGPKGSKVRLTILRKGQNGSERFTVTLTRDKIKLEEDAAQLSFLEREVKGEKRKLAVLNLPSFYADARRGGRSSAADMKSLIKQAKEQKADGLVLDLSNNGGGSLEDAVKIAGLFFKTGNVVKQSARDPISGEITLDDEDPTVDWDGPMVVLTSRISASASEIVAGTLKDYERAVIVGGDHTFGKGSVQTVVDLPASLGALKVTVGMFFTPGGFSTQHRGVDGDVVLPGPYSTDEIGEKSLDYSLPPKKLKPFLSPEAYANSGVGAWRKVDAGTVAVLKTKSAARVAKNEEFQKIVAESKKAKDKGKIIKLAEALKDNSKKKEEADQKKNFTPEEKQADYLKRADIQEAANILADLMEAQAKTLVLGAKSAEKPGQPEAKTR